MEVNFRVHTVVYNPMPYSIQRQCRRFNFKVIHIMSTMFGSFPLSIPMNDDSINYTCQVIAYISICTLIYTSCSSLSLTMHMSVRKQSIKNKDQKNLKNPSISSCLKYLIIFREGSLH